MNTKSIKYLSLIFLIIFCPTFLVAEKQKVVIPAIIALSGNASEQGVWVKQGLELATSQINQTTNLDLEVIFEDSQMNPKTALSAYRQLKNFNSFPAVITMGSGVAMALSPLVNQDQVIQMGVATETQEYSSKGDFNFRNFPSSDQGAAFAESYLTKKLNANKIAIIKIENEYGLNASKSFHGFFEKSPDREIVSEETIQPGDNNFRSQLLKVKQSSPDAIYLITYPNEGALILKQARQLGISTPIFATAAIIGSNNFIELSNNGAEGISIMTMSPLSDNNPYPLTKQFITDYENYFQKKPPVQAFLTTIAYDSIMMIAQGIINCNSTNTECLKNYLFTIKDYAGAGGMISFDQNGDIQTTFSVLTVKNGQFVLLE